MSEWAIETQGLSKRYGATAALQELSIGVPRGCVYGFLGPNGAGKTTTIRILAGLSEATSGCATVLGLPVSRGGGEFQRRLGYVPEAPAPYPWMTGPEVLRFAGAACGLDRADRNSRAASLLDRVGLSAASSKRVGAYSRGMRQRLALAAALVHRPEILILDEPVSALDPQGRREVLDLVKELRGTTTVFMSSHILDDIERVADMVGILREGRRVAEGPTRELLGRYAKPVFEVQAPSGPWVAELSARPFVTGVDERDGVVRVRVTSVDEARAPLLAFLAERAVPVTRVGVATPSLEEVFLMLAGKGS